MRKILFATLAAGALVLGLAAPAGAEKDTVQGTEEQGPISKMKANNAENKIFVKVFSTDGKNEIRSVDVYIKRKSDGKRYHAQRAHALGDYYKALSWDDNAPKNCDGFVFKYVNVDGTAKDHWRVVIPRSCVDKLTPKIKVKAQLSSTTNAFPGETPWTEWLSKG